MHYQTLEPQSYQLLNDLMEHEGLRVAGFVLAGGTSLALQLGHRMSTDIDLFTHKPFDPRQVAEELRQRFGPALDVYAMNDTGFRAFVGEVKIDMVYFPFKPQHPLIVKDKIRMLSVDDLSAMKVHAIANRGARRDFVDLAEILQVRPLEKILENYTRQFLPSFAAFQHTLKALTYFTDAEATPPKINIINGRNWNQTKDIVFRSMRQKKEIISQKAPVHIAPSNPHKKATAPAQAPVKSTATTTHQPALPGQKETMKSNNTKSTARRIIRPGRS